MVRIDKMQELREKANTVQDTVNALEAMVTQAESAQTRLRIEKQILKELETEINRQHQLWKDETLDQQ